MKTKQRPMLPLLLQLFHGSIGKEYVIKRTKWGKIKTRYPDMSGIVASADQRKCRDLFKEAVAYAKEVIVDSEKKKAWQKKLRRRNGVYNEAVKFYMKKDRLAKQRADLMTKQLIRQALYRQVPPGTIKATSNLQEVIPASVASNEVRLAANRQRYLQQCSEET